MIQDVVVARRPGRDLMFDLVLPSTGTGPWPVVAWVHGGAWIRGNRKRLPERTIAAFLARHLMRPTVGAT